MFLVALGTLAVAPAYAAPQCEGEIKIANGKLTVGKCWTTDPEAQELIAGACDEGDKCKVSGTITRTREIKVSWATGPKGMSFRMKMCPKCIEGLQKALGIPDEHVQER